MTSTVAAIQDVELVQNSAIRFISNLKRCTDSEYEERNQLQLQSLEDRNFLIQILQNEGHHHTLSTAYDEIARDRQLVTVTTRAAAGGETISIKTKKSVFYTYFLPWTIFEIRGKKLISIKQQNARTIFNSDPTIVKIECFFIGILVSAEVLP